MEPVLISILGLLGGSLFALIISILTGSMVPSGKVKSAEKERDRWRLAFETLRNTHAEQTKILERTQLSAEITDKVMEALHNSRKDES